MADTVSCLQCNETHEHDAFIAGLMAIEGPNGLKPTLANCERAWTEVARGASLAKCHLCPPTVRSRARPK